MATGILGRVHFCLRGGHWTEKYLAYTETLSYPGFATFGTQDRRDVAGWSLVSSEKYNFWLW